MRLRSTAIVVAAVVVIGATASTALEAQAQSAAPAPGATQTPSAAPGAVQTPAPAPAGLPQMLPPPATAQTPPAPAPPVVGVPPTPATPAARAFTAPVGLLFNTVRPERVADFEKVIGYVRAALEKSSDPRVQAQARGWQMYKATEAGPNGTVLYVFVMDPTVPGADYGFGRILADAYPDTAQLQEIWRLYTSSVTSGGSLLNLAPVMAVPPDAVTPAGAPAAAPAGRPVPLDANPNQPGR